MNATARTLLSLSLLLGACGGAATCPESSPAGSATTGGTGGERPLLAAEIDAPASMTVSIEGLDTPGQLDDRHVANVFGCTGQNHSPELRWSGAPEGTQSFVVEVHDPDAPTGVGFFHWIVADLPADVTSLAYDAGANLEHGVATRTDYGAPGWGGPCPPPGAPHRYVFTVYAVDTANLGVDANAAPAVVRFMLRSHTLAYGRAIATFGHGQ